MANTRFGINNLLTVAGRLRNGGAGPAVNQDAQYPMNPNLEVNDRATPWRYGTGTSAYAAEFDLGADMTMHLFAIHGFRLGAGEDAPTQVSVQYSTSAQGATFATSQPTITLARDSGVAPVSAVSARYVRFQFQGPLDPGFSVTNFYAGAMIDMGMKYSPRAEREIDTNRRDVFTPGGLPLSTYVGDEGGTFSLPFNQVTTTVKDKLLQVARSLEPITYFDAFDRVTQVVVLDGKFKEVHDWSPSDVWSGVLQLVRLP